MHIAQGWLSFGHLQCGDAQAPQVGAVVVRGVGVLVAGNDLSGKGKRLSDSIFNLLF